VAENESKSESNIFVSEVARQDFRMRYAKTLDDIENMKNRQWRITYYLLLLYSAILLFCGLLKLDVHWTPVILDVLLRSVVAVVTALIAIMGTRLLCRFKKDLSAYRSNLTENLNYLSESFRNFEEKALEKRFSELKDREKKRYCNSFRCWYTSGGGDRKFTRRLIIMLWIGAFFLWLYLGLPCLKSIIDC
jgi:hypothetical protein